MDRQPPISREPTSKDKKTGHTNNVLISEIAGPVAFRHVLPSAGRGYAAQAGPADDAFRPPERDQGTWQPLIDHTILRSFAARANTNGFTVYRQPSQNEIVSATLSDMIELAFERAFAAPKGLGVNLLTFSTFCIRRPVLALTGALVVVGAALPGIPRLTLRTDGHALVPQDAPAVAADARVREEFAIRDPLAVLIETDHPDGVFNVSTLRLVQAIDDGVGALPGVERHHVLSLASEFSDRVWPGTLNFRRFLEPIPETPEELDRLKQDLASAELYTGTLISMDYRSAVVLVGVPPGVTRQEFYGEVSRVVTPLETAGDRISVIGAPAAEALLGFHILEDLGAPERWIGVSTRGEMPTSDNAAWTFRLQTWIGRTVGLVPLSMAILAALFLILFRSPVLMMFALLEIGAAIVFVFGVMGWLGVPVYLTTAVLPVILVATGVTDEIHLFERYLHYSRSLPVASFPSQRACRTEATTRAMSDLVSPAIKTSVTTAVGFLSFALSPMEVVGYFGWFTALGVMFCLAWSLTVVPALLSLLGPYPDSAPADEARQPGRALAERVATDRSAWSLRRRWSILAATVLMVAMAMWGASKVVVQDSWIEGFARDSDFRRATERFNAGFLGTHLLHLRVGVESSPPFRLTLPATSVQPDNVVLPWHVVTAPESLAGTWMTLTAKPRTFTDGLDPGMSLASDPPSWTAPISGVARRGEHVILSAARQRGSPRTALRLDPNDQVELTITRRPMLEPATLRRLDEFSAAIRGHSDLAVGGVLGPAAYMKTMQFLTQGRRAEHRVIPDTPDRLEWLWAQYERIRGVERRRQLVTDDDNAGLVTVFLNNANFQDTARLLEVIGDLESKHLTPAGFRVEFAGDTAVSQTLIDAIVTTQVRSLVGSLLGTLVITTLLWRSIGLGALSTLPCGLAVLISFGVMGFTGMPLGVATSMFTAMTIGIGDDFAIHLLSRFRTERRAGASRAEATARALRWEGRSIRWDALCVCLGLGALTLSQVPANARLGALVALSVGTSLVATLVLLPALLSAGDRQDATSTNHS